MPLYEYTCRKCEHSFETLVTARTAAAVACPKCESDRSGPTHRPTRTRPRERRKAGHKLSRRRPALRRAALRP